MFVAHITLTQNVEHSNVRVLVNKQTNTEIAHCAASMITDKQVHSQYQLMTCLSKYRLPTWLKNCVSYTIIWLFALKNDVTNAGVIGDAAQKYEK